MTVLPDWTGRPTALLTASFFKQLPKLFPQALWHGRRDRRELALTFDDGPHPQDTLQLLALLKRHEVKATFFVVGERVKRYPHLVRAMADAGHQIGIHGYYHRPFALASPDVLRKQLAQAQQLIAEACACSPSFITSVRPPYGLFTPATIQNLLAWGYQPVMWSVAPLHWLQSAEVTIQQVLLQANNGALLVLHEGLAGPPAIALADPIIRSLAAAGFGLVTVDQLRAQLSDDGGET